jgi:hypothetical protein
MSHALPLAPVRTAVDRFVAWLARHGETSVDQQSLFAGRVGRAAKALYYRRPWLGTLAVAPMIGCEAFWPSARRAVGRPRRFPIADAHYAMGFALLAQATGDAAHHRRAVHFLQVLEATRTPGLPRHAWGYPFDWATRAGTIPAGTPLITTVPYVYEAFRHVYALDKDERWRGVMRSIAEHARHDYRDVPTASGAASAGYTPAADDPGGVVNASAYRAALLATAAVDFGEASYWQVGGRNLRFVLEAQQADGSWPYATDGHRLFVDHFHTCFVLKALARIEALTGDPRCTPAIARGVAYYVTHLFDPERRPRPFARAPRLTVYRRELYDFAECINLGVLLRGRFPELDRTLSAVVDELLSRWQRPDGAFRTRELLLGWDPVPMHRWAQSQTFRSLCALLAQEAR